ncbi:aminotransferase class I/II-fold pyridoxal phosphate-dependent enzyme [Streptomyces sp. NPDC058045]|uniref:aminotransferase class I/II-fold pyridoxal phosphate-dependent enzyme n=1 Tax=Streptomyces sp. NPDC058045 TaxID=3346311 RepID=UPI0036F0B48C
MAGPQAEPDAGYGPVRFGPGLPGDGLAVPPEAAAALAGAAAEGRAEPLGGGPALLDAVRGFAARRGLTAGPDRLVAAPGAPALLLALTAAVGGEVLLPRPCCAWWAPGARLLGRAVYPVPTPVECGGVPDPYALLETVRRVRAEGGDPRLLVLSVADDPTATVPPPEVLHETVEAAAGAGLHIVSDETLRDTRHPAAAPGPATGGKPRPTVAVSPAEMVPDQVTVLSDLSGALLPPGWPAAFAVLPPTADGHRLRGRVLDALTALGGRIGAPVAAAAAYALAEPPAVTGRVAATARLHGTLAAAAYRLLRRAGVLLLPPQAGRHLYADLGPLRPALAARGIGDAQDLEDHLGARLGMPAPGGHRFGDHLSELRVRLPTWPLAGATEEQRGATLTAPDPLELPPVRAALSMFAAVFDDLGAAR